MCLLSKRAQSYPTNALIRYPTLATKALEMGPFIGVSFVTKDKIRTRDMLTLCSVSTLHGALQYLQASTLSLTPFRTELTLLYDATITKLLRDSGPRWQAKRTVMSSAWGAFGAYFATSYS
jgi:hypothetical protein